MADDRTQTHILLVEDDFDHIGLARKVFKKYGVDPHVHVVRNGAEALDFVFGSGPYAGQGIPASLKLILLDLKLPKMDGLDVLSRLKLDPRTESIPVVVVTVSHANPDLSQSFTMGASDYIIKPMEYDRFVEVYNTYVLHKPKG